MRTQDEFTRHEILSSDKVAPAVSPATLLEIEDLSIEYRGTKRNVGAVRDVTLSIAKGEILGLAGESGSGKSTMVFGACRLLRPPGVITGGSVKYYGRNSGGQSVDLMELSAAELRALRWSEIAMVFQSAMSALNPVMRIDAQIKDAIAAHRHMTGAEYEQRLGELFELVGIPHSRLRSYPHQLSGGMRQRVMIAMALALEPELVIMDEPTTALDVVLQREILSQIIELKDRLGFSVLFITHDLSLLVEISNRLAVMYGGRVVEIGDTDNIRRAPQHPYTKALLGSFPSITGPKKELHGMAGIPIDLAEPPRGCPFGPRCPHFESRCLEADMVLRPSRGTAGGSDLNACILEPHIVSPIQLDQRSEPR